LEYLSPFLLDSCGAAYWTNKWNEYADNPNNSTAKSEVETRLQALVTEMLSLPHYQVF
jgi:hypothetical protein